MHSLLENYLAEVAAQLAPLPAARRNDELQEMRQHLLNAVTVNREMGQNEDEAAQTALEQFGTPEELGEKVVWAWRRGEIYRRRDLLGATACALFFALLLPRLLFPLEKPHVLQAFHAGRPWVWSYTMVLLWQVPPFLLAGAISGFVFPKRGVAGTWLAVGVSELFYFVRNTLKTHIAGLMGCPWIVGLEIGSLVFLSYGVYVLAAVLGAWAARRGRLACLCRSAIG